MITQNQDTINFWNSEDVNSYFSQKKADFRVLDFLKKCSKEINVGNYRVLDLGCGAGRHIFEITKLGFDIYGVDINPAMILSSKTAYETAGGQNVEKHILEGQILNIPFENNFFDFCVTTGVLHQARSLEEYQNSIEELSRVLKSGAGVSLNIFTNKVNDDTYKWLSEFVVETKEGLFMTLLSSEKFYELMEKFGLQLVEELAHDIKEENTGPRAVLRANFIKK